MGEAVDPDIQTWDDMLAKVDTWEELKRYRARTRETFRKAMDVPDRRALEEDHLEPRLRT